MSSISLILIWACGTFESKYFFGSTVTPYCQMKITDMLYLLDVYKGFISKFREFCNSLGLTVSQT